MSSLGTLRGLLEGMPTPVGLVGFPVVALELELVLELEVELVLEWDPVLLGLLLALLERVVPLDNLVVFPVVEP